MQLVIADTGPVNYLILIGHIDLLPDLFARIVLPAIVRDDLKHRKASLAVRNCISDPPSWVEIHETPHVLDPSLDVLDLGEEDAIALAVELYADLILMDDRDGVLVARSKGFGLRAPSAFSQSRQSAAFSIWLMHSHESSGPVSITGRKPWIS